LDRRARHQPHAQRRRHRPEASQGSAQQYASDEQDRQVGGEDGQQVGDRQHRHQGQHHQAAVEATGQHRGQRRGEGADHGRGRHGLPRRPDADPEIGGQRSQHAGGQELRGDEGEDAHGQGDHARPGGRRLSLRLWPDFILNALGQS